MISENRNTILAIVLSLIVLLGWQYFVAAPQLERQQAELQAQQEAAQKAATGTTNPDAPQPTGSQGANTAAPAAGQQAAFANRDTALAASQRVTIDTPSLEGSLNLKGGRLDDIRLKDYHETVDKSSPTIVLFSPSGSPKPYYADYGWVGDPGSNIALPGPDTIWSIDGETTLTPSTPVTLSWDNGAGLIFKRTFSVDDNYMFTVNQAVENTGADAVTLYPYGLIARKGMPETNGIYILHEGLLGVFGADGLKEVDYDDLMEEGSIRPSKVDQGWLGITDKYWAATLIPTPGQEFQPGFSHSATTDVFQADYLGNGVTIAGGATGESSSYLFAGAKETKVLDGYEEALGIERFELLIDWGWFYFLTKPMFFAIDWFFHLFGNFGVAILVVTVIVKLIFFPLANKSYVSMSKMKLVQPQMTEIREKYSDDRQKQQQALMELYKKEKINPLAGCLPILVQIPVFFALYKVLYVTIEMRHAPFFGWIQDLSAPDPTTIFNLFGLIPWDPPQMLMLGVWPLIMGITMFIQMKMNPAPPDPTQQMIFTWMPVIFTFMLASFPAGLVIYWAWNNTLSVTQQYVIMRRQGAKVELWDNLGALFKRKKPAPDDKS
ncbi:Membrane protein insertase YidC [Labrenzia sp. THAF191b]|uniref:membrane protein insertase YidC n=1 Tax=unclassified Labrenzia TaxID=2648686 RepID=UPI0012A9269F|nr:MULTISPECIES: membrane protein insertase YidC [unclassified Labrenzia]QFS96163.1 Membrane protein insertase YidC [Labrenzia sp. THAF191b]QFT02478.1 Membrane protein insertase YidC [Labrenzia sp. THAF191a]QFT14020.1 Membrane protein insertase YidC [Labrenzia sp. THAF187b]